MDLPDAERVEQLDERIGLLLCRATNRRRRTVVARAGRLDDSESVFRQPLVAKVRVARRVATLEDED